MSRVISRTPPSPQAPEFQVDALHIQCDAFPVSCSKIAGSNLRIQFSSCVGGLAPRLTGVQYLSPAVLIQSSLTRFLSTSSSKMLFPFFLLIQATFISLSLGQLIEGYDSYNADTDKLIRPLTDIAIITETEPIAIVASLSSKPKSVTFTSPTFRHDSLPPYSLTEDKPRGSSSL